MTNLFVRPIEDHENAAWDTFVRSSKTGTLFHTSIWKSIIDVAYGDGTYSLTGVYDNERLVGGFCALTRTRLGIATAVTPLCTPYTGFVFSGSGAAKQAPGGINILAVLVPYLRRYRYQNLQCLPDLPWSQQLAGSGYHLTPRRTLEIDLQQPEEKIWSGFSGQVRRNIKKAEKSGAVISSQWDGAQAYRIFRETFARHGERCPVPEKLFSEISDGAILSSHRRRYCAWRGGTMEAFIVALRYNGQVYYALAGTGTEALKTGISSLLIWQMLRDHLDGEWETFDFVGANTPSITQFKEGFNPALRNYFAAELCLSRRIAFARKAQEYLRRR